MLAPWRDRRVILLIDPTGTPNTGDAAARILA